ncbi:MAG: hypothetical protein IID33_01095 [Planctomycetes bacterium]|nr:hypothetical protein [Planctomycetota bacterium]
MSLIIAIALVAPAGDGHIRGRLLDAKNVTEVLAVDRERDAVITAGYDSDTGEFRFSHLERGRRYDLIIRTAKSRIEGVDMRLADAGHERNDDTRPFEAEDEDEIRSLIIKPKRFMNEVEPLYVRGRDRQAVALVSLARTREFHSSKRGEVVWRVELWRFRWQFGGWERVPNVENVLYRERIKGKTWESMRVAFDPALGGLRPGSSEKPLKLEYRVPPPSQSKPVSAVERTTTQPASRP